MNPQPQIQLLSLHLLLSIIHQSQSAFNIFLDSQKFFKKGIYLLNPQSIRNISPSKIKRSTAEH